MVPAGWPDIPDDRWHDIQAVCAMKNLPLDLDRAALVAQADKALAKALATKPFWTKL